MASKSQSQSLIDAINATEKAAQDAIDGGDYEKAAKLTEQAQTFKTAYHNKIR